MQNAEYFCSCLWRGTFEANEPRCFATTAPETTLGLFCCGRAGGLLGAERQGSTSWVLKAVHRHTWIVIRGRCSCDCCCFHSCRYYSCRYHCCRGCLLFVFLCPLLLLMLLLLFCCYCCRAACTSLYILLPVGVGV